MFTINEHYHIYNRGAHKEPIFRDESDFERFVALLYLANSQLRLDFKRIKPAELFNQTKTRPRLVDVIAYCLMPNHFHIVMKEIIEGGISRFMHKLCTSYSMYFNLKYDHSGTIFQGPFKSKHVGNDDYFRYLIQYVHLNPYGIDEPELMKTAKQENLDEAISVSREYEYSSYKDYLGEDRPQKVILQPATRRGLVAG